MHLATFPSGVGEAEGQLRVCANVLCGRILGLIECGGAILVDRPVLLGFGPEAGVFRLYQESVGTSLDHEEAVLSTPVVTPGIPHNPVLHARRTDTKSDHTDVVADLLALSSHDLAGVKAFGFDGARVDAARKRPILLDLVHHEQLNVSLRCRRLVDGSPLFKREHILGVGHGTSASWFAVLANLLSSAGLSLLPSLGLIVAA